jgi:two-component system, OmpR family, response regulator
MSSVGRRILLVEDDQNFGEVLLSYLELHEYDVTLAADGVDGWEKFRHGEFDLIILDVMMPKRDGFTLAKDIRERNTEVPLVFLTARVMKEDELMGFKVGADDYLNKPFIPAVLLARIQAIMKRSAPKLDPRDEVKDFDLGAFSYHAPMRQLVLHKGKSNEQLIKLTPKEGDLLKLMLLREGEVIPRSEVLIKIWGEDNYFKARSMDVFLTSLRKHLSLDPNVELTNIHGSGFLLRVKA